MGFLALLEKRNFACELKRCFLGEESINLKPGDISPVTSLLITFIGMQLFFAWQAGSSSVWCRQKRLKASISIYGID
jgi:hypothetical protein